MELEAIFTDTDGDHVHVAIDPKTHNFRVLRVTDMLSGIELPNAYDPAEPVEYPEAEGLPIPKGKTVEDLLALMCMHFVGCWEDGEESEMMDYETGIEVMYEMETDSSYAKYAEVAYE